MFDIPGPKTVPFFSTLSWGWFSLSIARGTALEKYSSALYTVHGTLYTVNCKPYTVHCKLQTVHCKLYTVHFTLDTWHCMQSRYLYTVHCTLYTIHYTALGSIAGWNLIETNQFSLLARKEIWTTQEPSPALPGTNQQLSLWFRSHGSTKGCL